MLVASWVSSSGLAPAVGADFGSCGDAEVAQTRRPKIRPTRKRHCSHRDIGVPSSVWTLSTAGALAHSSPRTTLSHSAALAVLIRQACTPVSLSTSAGQRAWLDAERRTSKRAKRPRPAQRI